MFIESALKLVRAYRDFSKSDDEYTRVFFPTAQVKICAITILIHSHVKKYIQDEYKS